MYVTCVSWLCQSSKLIETHRVLFQLSCFADTIKPTTFKTSPNWGAQGWGQFWEIPTLYAHNFSRLMCYSEHEREMEQLKRHSAAATTPPPPSLPRSGSSRKCLKQTQSCDCFDSSNRWFPMEQVSPLIHPLPPRFTRKWSIPSRRRV